MAVLLHDERVVQLLSQYTALDGDQQLRKEEHGNLLPQVVAWLIKYTEKGGVFLLNIPVTTRNKLLQKFVFAFLDREEPNLRSFIIRSRQQDAIHAIGEKEQRLSSIKSEEGWNIYIPDVWLSPQVVDNLRKFQNGWGSKVAQLLGEKLIKPRQNSEDNVKKACLAAINYKRGLLLQHESKLINIKKALEEGRLKSRHHIENKLFGTSSHGLLIHGMHPKAYFTFFSRTSSLDDPSRTIHFREQTPDTKARIVINGLQFLVENPQVVFLIVGYYPYFAESSVTTSGGKTIIVNPSRYAEDEHMYQVAFNTSNDHSQAIYQKLFELLISDIIPSSEHQLIEQLTNPQTESDYELAHKLLALLPLEWLIPGDVPLKFSYVEEVNLGTKVYSLTELRRIALEDDEAAVLQAINTYEDIEQLPFVLEGMLKIALQRTQNEVIKQIYKMTYPKYQDSQAAYKIVGYPKELYEIESMVQLILEDFSNDRVYVHYTGDAIHIQSTLKVNTNRYGAHHAEMAKLHYALGIGSVVGHNALEILLPNTLSVPIGPDAKYKNLVDIRDALLTYELTTLLVCVQNLQHYEKNQGAFHPQTGRGATNGRVALMENRLDNEGRIAVNSNGDSELLITTTDIALANTVAQAINKYIPCFDAPILIDTNTVVLSIKPAELIAKLRNQAICYEGINVITEDGRYLLAKRFGKGLASAGGHHGDKYTPKGIAYGLYSEFGLKLRKPDSLTDIVTLLPNVKTLSKTGIYIIPYSGLTSTAKVLEYARVRGGMSVDFYADPDEFEPQSEVALNLVEMRNRLFYDVMPLSALCQYQLDALKIFLKALQPQGIELQINDEVQEQSSGGLVFHKVPSPLFGRMTITIREGADEDLKHFFIQHSALHVADEVSSYSVYYTDESPLVLLKALREEVAKKHPAHFYKTYTDMYSDFASVFPRFTTTSSSRFFGTMMFGGVKKLPIVSQEPENYLRLD